MNTKFLWNTPIKKLPFKLVVQDEAEIWRAADFWIKEPETIAWIDSFAPGSVFWDIGANIGVFSLYAVMKGVRVESYEPEPKNFDRLQENIEANGFYKKQIYARNIAMSDFIGKGRFDVSESMAGYSRGQLKDYDENFSGTFVRTIDQQVKSLGISPTHIKIDVDGHEWRILQGAAVTLGNPELKSVLVEVNNCYADIDGYMKSFGFSDFNRFNGPDINRRANQKSRNVIYLR